MRASGPLETYFPGIPSTGAVGRPWAPSWEGQVRLGLAGEPVFGPTSHPNAGRDRAQPVAGAPEGGQR